MRPTPRTGGRAASGLDDGLVGLLLDLLQVDEVLVDVAVSGRRRAGTETRTSAGARETSERRGRGDGRAGSLHLDRLWGASRRERGGGVEWVSQTSSREDERPAEPAARGARAARASSARPGEREGTDRALETHGQELGGLDARPGVAQVARRRPAREHAGELGAARRDELGWRGEREGEVSESAQETEQEEQERT